MGRQITNQRKHREQMSRLEIESIMAQVRSCMNTFSISAHTRERMSETGISEHDIRDAIRRGELIEAHRNIPGDTRVLVELIVEPVGRVSVVISLKSGEVKTVWFNNYHDTHATRDWSQYKLTGPIIVPADSFCTKGA